MRLLGTTVGLLRTKVIRWSDLKYRGEDCDVRDDCDVCDGCADCDVT